MFNEVCAAMMQLPSIVTKERSIHAVLFVNSCLGRDMLVSDILAADGFMQQCLQSSLAHGGDNIKVCTWKRSSREWDCP